MARLRESPPILWAFAAFWLAEFVIASVLFGGDAPLRIYVAAFAVQLIAIVFLLRGSRVAWSLFVLGAGAAALSLLARGHWGSGAVRAALLLMLLVAGAPQYVWRRRN